MQKLAPLLFEIAKGWCMYAVILEENLFELFLYKDILLYFLGRVLYQK